MNETLEHYTYRGARTLVLLHDTHMRRCLDVWRQAKAADIELPETANNNYESLETLLMHVLGAARGYMVWICEQLNLPDPEINPRPEASRVEAEAERYLEHLLERWRLPLANVERGKFGPETYRSNWGTHYCIDAMLEHAVMHPIRHEFQLRELMQQQS